MNVENVIFSEKIWLGRIVRVLPGVVSFQTGRQGIIKAIHKNTAVLSFDGSPDTSFFFHELTTEL